VRRTRLIGAGAPCTGRSARHHHERQRRCMSEEKLRVEWVRRWRATPVPRSDGVTRNDSAAQLGRGSRRSRLRMSAARSRSKWRPCRSSCSPSLSRRMESLCPPGSNHLRPKRPRTPAPVRLPREGGIPSPAEVSADVARFRAPGAHHANARSHRDVTCARVSYFRQASQLACAPSLTNTCVRSCR
jgi:hypothetical protein